MSEEFNPDWCVAPAEMLAEWMREHGLTRGMLARRCGRGEADVKAALLIRDVLDRKPLLEAHAEMLAQGTDVSARFWLNLERDYRDGLAAGRTDFSAPLRSAGDPGHRQHDGDQGNADQAVEHGKDPS